MFSWLLHDIAVSDALIRFRCIVLQNAGYSIYISVADEYSPVMFLCPTEIASLNY